MNGNAKLFRSSVDDDKDIQEETHTHRWGVRHIMWEATHQVTICRSSYFHIFGCVVHSKLRQLWAWWSHVTCHNHFLITTITFACLCPTTPRTLFLPASHPRYGRWGPRERPQAPSGEFPLCSAPYLLTTHHHHLLPHHQPWRTPTRAKLGRASHLVPHWLHWLDYAHPASNVTRISPPCHGKCNHRPKSTPPRKHNFGLRLTVHENTYKTAHLPTATTQRPE